LLVATLTSLQTPDPAVHRTRVLRSWHDSVKLSGQDVRRSVDVVFDYTSGLAREIARDGSGKILSNRILRSAPPPSREEIAEAVGLVSADPELGRMMSRTKAVPDGGFLLAERSGGACGPGTRCIQVLLFSPDRVGGLRRVVVDLTRQSIAYRAYVPSLGQGVKK
jgi:hypothetical protein